MNVELETAYQRLNPQAQTADSILLAAHYQHLSNELSLNRLGLREKRRRQGMLEEVLQQFIEKQARYGQGIGLTTISTPQKITSNSNIDPLRLP